MTIPELRAKYWQLRNLMQQQGQLTPTLDRQISLMHLEILVEIAADLKEMQTVLARVGVLNFEELALRLEEVFSKAKE